jgi:hypothetical protein
MRAVAGGDTERAAAASDTLVNDLETFAKAMLGLS